MAFLFKRTKTPAELCKFTRNQLKTLSEQKSDEKSIKTALEKLSKYLNSMKTMLYGDGENDPNPKLIQELCDDLLNPDSLLVDLLVNMKKLEFEARKDVAQVYNFLLRQRKEKAAEYIKTHSKILTLLVQGYTDIDVALNCGSILREVLRIEDLNQMLLQDRMLLEPFFDYVQLSTFDVASDAFHTFRLMLTKHVKICAKYLEANYAFVFIKLNTLLNSKNYVTKRQSLKLLGELLLNRANFAVMMKYINDPDNLKIMMNLLRGTTKAIQFEAFQVFKIFVANPKKAVPIIEILVRNKKKLIEFLRKFQKDKEDETFNQEKELLLTTLANLDGASVGIDESKLNSSTPVDPGLAPDAQLPEAVPGTGGEGAPAQDMGRLSISESQPGTGQS